jgi:hypothetical protein
MEHFKTILNVSEQQLIMNLHNDWKQYIYARTQKLRLYEKVFWEWGKLWFECSNKFNLY